MSARVTIVFDHGTPEARVDRPSWRYLTAADLEAARVALVHELSACTGEQIRRERTTGEGQVLLSIEPYDGGSR